MQHILVLGAGLSSSYLIKYLLANAKKENWHITVADQSLALAESKIKKHPLAKAIALDVSNKEQREAEIKKADIVVSLLPPTLHILAAKECIKCKKHLVTASYISDEMKSLHNQALKADVLFLNEIGLDPGIDHLSAMEMIHGIQTKGGEIVSFKSYCGGLVAPEFDNNPWNYKFTWNPRNVILAGQATAKYLEDVQVKFIPANRIFTQTQDVSVKGCGKFESYANRDSLGYIEPYGITSARTVLRGTLRKKGYSLNWNNLVKLGLTDDTFQIQHSHEMSYRNLLCAFIPSANDANIEDKLSEFLNISKSSKEYKRITWLGLLSNDLIGLKNASPAQILQNLLQQKWKLEKTDLDMIVMKHEITYKLGSKIQKADSTLVVKGEDAVYTAMAKTVGLPLAIATKLILQGKINSRGVQIPVHEEFYKPILKELEKFGVKFF
jgi:saccharopine dehydrogenase-like NADP-dependent oxidoreductase